MSPSSNIAAKMKSIGVFDSGIGGLTVVHALMRHLPNENITYFGDTARVPYGSKSAEVVREYAFEDTAFLMTQGVKLIVAACNTVSAIAIDDLRAHFDIPIVGMIDPGVDAAIHATSHGNIGVIGTLATIASESYRNALHRQDGSVHVTARACPLFVPLAEEGWNTHPVAQMVADEYLLDLRDRNIDTLILGCTHYPILRDVIQHAVGADVTLIDSGEAAARQVEHLLREQDMLNPSTDQPRYEFFVSDVPQKFQELGQIFLGRPDLRVTKVHLA
ncbi:MAG: glutamate racemase [Bacteroidota bacterium]|jgi:glutamate racemase|nr:glutamate racemase [Bacteroidota bacterium]